jgi:hypothetical protein
MTEAEEFEFRMRLESEQGQANSAPVSAVQRIPTGGDVAPAPIPVRNPTLFDSALQGAMAVPVVAGFARGAQLLARGSRAAPYTGQLAAAVIPQSGRALLTEGAIGAAAGAAGGFAASQVPEEYSGLAEIGAGAVVGAGAGGAVGAVGNLFGLKAGMSNLISPLSELADQIAKASGAGKASKQAITALSANPSLAGSIGRAMEIEQNTGISLPMLAASNGDTTISSYMQSQIAKGDNSPFTAQVKQQYLAAEKALAEARKGLPPSIKEVDDYVKRKAVETNTANLAIVSKAAAATAKRDIGLENIDARIAELTNTLRQAPGRTDIGERVVNLLNSKRKMEYAKVGPKYDELIESSEAAGIRLPGEIAKDLRDFVRDETSQDVFNKFPSLYKSINNVFKGEIKQQSTRMQAKYPNLAKPQETFKDYSLKALDSLKRETNEALRSTQSGSDQQRMLRELKVQVDNAIDNVDPLFSVPYRAIDKEYALKVGIPFTEKGVVNINRASFVEDAVPQLTKNASALKQTMDIIGDSPEGRKIVEDAFLFDIGNNRSIINTNTGELNPAQLARYIKANKDKIDLVPGLKNTLEDVGNRVSVLRDNRTAILEAEKAAKIDKIDNLWTQAYGASGGMRGVVQSSLRNPQELDNLLAIAGKDRVAKEGIKSAFLENLISSKGDRLALLKENEAAVAKIFSKDQAKLLTDVVEASQLLKDNPFRMAININTISKSDFETKFGSKPETSLGELRNQVISGPRVFINHLSRFFSNVANKNEAAEVQKFLLDPKALQQAADLLNEIKVKGFNQRALDALGKLTKNSASNWLLGATAGGIAGAQDYEKPPGYTPTDETLMEGFGQ